MKQYLGDSVYVELENGMIKLTTDNGYDDDPRNIIYMEPNVLRMFKWWIKSFREELEKHANRQVPLD